MDSGRVGPTLVIAGVAIVAAALLLQFGSEYWYFQTYQFAYVPEAGYRLYEQLNADSFLLLGPGVGLVGVGWATSRRAASRSRPAVVGSEFAGERLGIALAVVGPLLFAGWSLAYGIAQECASSGSSFLIPIWFAYSEGLFAGVGVVLWGSGWWILRNRS
jgi:hypothetical protein